MDMPHRLTRIASIRAVLLAQTIFLGCEDDAVIQSQYSITEEEAAVVVAHALGSASSTYGLTGQIEEVAHIATGGTLRKGTGRQRTGTDTITFIRSKPGPSGYEYTIRLSHGFSGGQFEATYGMRGRYETPAMESQDTLNASLRFTSLQAETLLVNGYFWRLGRLTSSLGERKTFTSEIVATFDRVGVARTLRTAIGGNVTFTVIARFPDGSVISVPGTITYLHDHRAVLVINRKAYDVNLDTATITVAD